MQVQSKSKSSIHSVKILNIQGLIEKPSNSQNVFLECLTWLFCCFSFSQQTELYQVNQYIETSKQTTEWLDTFVVHCNKLVIVIICRLLMFDIKHTVSMIEKIERAFMFQFNSKYIKITIKIFQTKM